MLRVYGNFGLLVQLVFTSFYDASSFFVFYFLFVGVFGYTFFMIGGFKEIDSEDYMNLEYTTTVLI